MGQGILIATPCYGGQAFVPFIDSCYYLKKELDAAGIDHDFLRGRNESLVTRARNILAADFLFHTNFSHLLFWDADISADPAGVARLWNMCVAGADVAVGAYRIKKPDSELSAWIPGDKGANLKKVSDYTEPFEVVYAGTGFMMIKRETFESLMKAHPEWEYREGFMDEETSLKDTPVKKCWAFFQDPIEDGIHLSEDYFFCKRVREQNMNIMCDPEIKLTHWGLYGY